MASPSRREKISGRLAESSFVRNVVGPKVLEPASDWYRDRVQDSESTSEDGIPDAPDSQGAPQGSEDADPDSPSTEGPSPDSASALAHEIDGQGPASDEIDLRTPATAGAPSTTLASAQAAEAFLAGPAASDDPLAAEDTTRTESPEEQPAAADGAPAPRGRLARIKAITMGVKTRVKDHNLNVVAAGVAFWGLLAIPATLTAVVSIYGLVSTPEQVENQIEDSLSGASAEVQTIIGDQLRSVAGASGGGLAIGAIVGILLALWTTSGAVSKVIATLNTIWGVKEDRGFIKLRGMAVALTVGAIAFVGGAAFLLAALPATLDEAGLGDAARWSLNIARFPLLLVVMAVGLSVLYWAGPNRRGRLRLLTWGATIATVLWLVLSGLFSFYTASFASYNETYGSLGAIVIMLLWLFITAFVVLLGAEIDAERESLDDRG